MATFAADLSTMESVLVHRLRRSEESAFQDLMRYFGRRIHRTAMRILKEEESAKDALQETLINIHRSIRNFRGEAQLSTWINRITVNVCLEMIRKNKRHANRVDEDVSDWTNLEDTLFRDPYTQVRQNEIRERVVRALDRLSKKHRVVVRMHDLEGFTIKEIAEQIGVAEGTIKSRLFYGREELRHALAA